MASLLLVSVVLTSLYLFFNYILYPWTKFQAIPASPPSPFLGDALRIDLKGGWDSINAYLLGQLKSLGKIFWLPFTQIIVIADPMHIPSFANNEVAPVYNHYWPLLKGGLLTSTTTDWKIKRSMVELVFSSANLRQFSSQLIILNRSLIATLTSNTKENVKTILRNFSMDVNCSLVMGEHFNCLAKGLEVPILQPLFEAIAYCDERFNDVLARINPIKTYKLYKAVAKLHSQLQMFIQKVQQNPLNKGWDSVLDSLLVHQSDYIIPILTEFLMAGRETTSNLIFNSLSNVAKNYDLLIKLRVDLEQYGLFPAIGELKEAPLLTNVLWETLRLDPSVVQAKLLTEENWRKLGEKKPNTSCNTFALFPFFLINRNPAIWHNPENFDPVRDFKAALSTTFFPFGFGQHKCIAQSLGLITAKSSLCAIIQKFDIEEIEGQLKLHFLG